MKFSMTISLDVPLRDAAIQAVTRRLNLVRDDLFLGFRSGDFMENGERIGGWEIVVA